MNHHGLKIEHCRIGPLTTDTEEQAEADHSLIRTPFLGPENKIPPWS